MIRTRISFKGIDRDQYTKPMDSGSFMGSHWNSREIKPGYRDVNTVIKSLRTTGHTENNPSEVVSRKSQTIVCKHR